MKNDIIEKYKKEGLVVPATYDKVFKAVMQDKNCKEYLIEIIHEITKMEKEYIRENMVIRNSELPVKYAEEKRKVTDLVIDIENNLINIEMNNSYYKGLIERNDTYLNELRNLKSSEGIYLIPKMIQINFDNFDKYKEKTIMKFVIMNEETHVKETENYEKYHINLKRIKKKYYNKEKLSEIEKKLLVLTLDKKEEIKKITKGDKIMEEVEKKIVAISEDAAMILCYDEDEYREKVRELSAQTRIEEAIEEAQELAMKKAEELAMKKAEEIASKKVEEIAMNMIKQNLDYEIISKTTGLSLKELERLNDKN